MLNMSQDSPSLSASFKRTTARLPPFRRNQPASLSLVLRQWYYFFTIDFCYPNITAQSMSQRPIHGIMYLGAPFSFALLQLFPLHRGHCAVVGLVIMMIGLVASSFPTRVSPLILTQGVLYAIGGSMLYPPTIIFLDECFIARKRPCLWGHVGRNRCSFSLSALKSRPRLVIFRLQRVCIPCLMNWEFSTEYSFSTVLRVWSLVLLLLVGPPPIPCQAPSTSRPNISYSSARWGFAEDHPHSGSYRSATSSRALTSSSRTSTSLLPHGRWVCPQSPAP